MTIKKCFILAAQVSVLTFGNLPLSLAVAVAATTAATTAPKETTTCRATREFVTALEFLRGDDDFKLKESDARDLAFKIVNGCTGAASRFIRVSKTLIKAGASQKNASELALRFSTGTDAEADAFISAFRRSIAEDGLDLDFDSSLKIASSLSKEFSGDLKKVRKDFEKLVDYCSDESSLNLPKNQCGSFAAKIASLGEPWKDGIAKPYIQAFEYLSSEKGPGLVTGDALAVAETVVTDGPGGFDNFKQAYQYATSDKGLGMRRDEAVAFAKKLTAIRAPEFKTEKPKEAQVKQRGR
jgi:hypothetical protein